MRALLREDSQTHRGHQEERTIEKNRSFHKILRKSIGNGQIVSMKDKSGVEERDLDKIKTITEKFYEKYFVANWNIYLRGYPNL